MKTMLIIMILLFNIFSVFLSIRMLKGYESQKIAIAVILGEGILFILCNIIYAITSGGIPYEVHQASKWFIILTMLPINMLIIFCPVANEINKKSFNEVTDEKFINRMIFYIIIAIVLLIVEIIYVKSIQRGIKDMGNILLSH